MLSRDEIDALGLTQEQHARFIRRIYGSAEFIRGLERYCLWIEERNLDDVMHIEAIRQRIEGARAMRLASPKSATIETADVPHKFGEIRQNGVETVIIVPSVSSESRDCLPVGYMQRGTIVSNLAFALYDAPLWNMALIASRLHLVWIGTVCGKLKTDFRYSNTLGWNTFPVPLLTEQNKADLTACAETSCWPAKRISPPPSRTCTTRTPCRKTCATPTSATTRCWSASTSAAASRTTLSAWRNCSTSTPRWPRRRGRRRARK